MHITFMIAPATKTDGYHVRNCTNGENILIRSFQVENLPCF